MSNHIYLVTLYLDTPLYLTDMHRDINYNGHPFTSGKFRVDSTVVQKSKPSANDFSLTFSAVDQTMVSAITTVNYKGRRCLIERVTLNDDETIDSVETWLDGDLHRYTYKNKLKESILTLIVGSIFAAFEGVKMLNIAVQFEDTINNDETIYWGKEAPTVPVVVPPRTPIIVDDSDVIPEPDEGDI